MHDKAICICNKTLEYNTYQPDWPIDLRVMAEAQTGIVSLAKIHYRPCTFNCRVEVNKVVCWHICWLSSESQHLRRWAHAEPAGAHANLISDYNCISKFLGIVRLRPQFHQRRCTGHCVSVRQEPDARYLIRVTACTYIRVTTYTYMSASIESKI